MNSTRHCFGAAACLAALTAAAADPPAAAPSPVACGAEATVSREYAFFVMGNRAGFQTVCVLRDGSREVTFAYNDRGRGPALTSRIALDVRGVPTSVATAGNDYFKSPIAERFVVADGNATWNSKVEAGSRRIGEPAFYLSQSGVPEETGLLTRALRNAPQHRMPLLPQGEAELTQLSEIEASVGGLSRRVTLYAVTGLGFQPTNVWLDEDGDTFAILDGFSSLVRAGWEPAVEALRDEQNRRDALRRAELARQLRRTPTSPLVIQHANLFDAESGRMLRGTTVIISQNRITAVGPDGSLAIPPGAETIDAAGRALLPGLWDMHTHPDLNDGALFLAAGVTSVRDMAAEADKPQRLRVFETGEALGPRVTFAGIIDGRGPFQAPTQVLVSNESEARAAVRAMAEAGLPMVKIYSSVDPQLVPVIVDEARRHGMRVGGHVPAFMTAEQAVRAGYDEIQHMNMLFLSFLFDEVKDTRTPARFTAVAEHAPDIDLRSERVRKFLALLKERKVTIDPTLGAFETLFTDRPGQVAAGYAAVADRMPVLVRRGFLEGGLPVPEGSDARYRAAFRAMQQMLMALRQAGIPFVAGTDAMAGFSLARELELYVQAGVPAAEVLRIATLEAARLAGRGNELGSIAPGKLADMIIVDGDPSLNISDVRRLRMVVKDGALLDPDALCRSLGIRPLN